MSHPASEIERALAGVPPDQFESLEERAERERARLAAGAEAFREHRADLERRRERLAAERGGQVAGP